jgi:hypothetical protein
MENVVEALNKEIIPLLRELRSAMALIAQGSAPVGPHADSHEFGGSDALEGALLNVAFPAVNYTAALDLLLFHLAGIDDALSPYLVYLPEPVSHVFVLEDAFKTIACTHAAAVTHTIPLHATIPYEVGTVLRFLWASTGQPTIAAAGTLVAPDGAKVSAASKFVFAEQTAIDTWLLSGSCAV